MDFKTYGEQLAAQGRMKIFLSISENQNVACRISDCDSFGGC